MSTHRPDQPAPPPPPDGVYDDRLERYLDGLMSPQEQARFEAETAGDAAVQTQIAGHRRMCAALSSLAQPESSTPNPIHLADAVPQPARAPRRRRLARLAAIAAAVALPVAAAVWYFGGGFVQPSDPTGPTDAQWQAKTRERVVREYKSQLAAGFKPAEVCTTDEQFAKWTREKFDVALKPSHPAPGTGRSEPVLAGWSRADIFSAYTGVLLARVDGEPVIVVMDTAPPDRFIPPDDASGSPPPRVFRRKVAGMWMVEVTPLTEPRIITQIESAAP